MEIYIVFIRMETVNYVSSLVRTQPSAPGGPCSQTERRLFVLFLSVLGAPAEPARARSSEDRCTDIE